MRTIELHIRLAMNRRFTRNVTSGIVLLKVELNFRHRLLSTVSGMNAMETSHEMVCGEEGMFFIQQSKLYYLSVPCILDLLELQW
jgi:hypothetical protein